MVYAKPPFGGAQQVLDYLGRYTHRVAISNNRLLRFDGDSVLFRWKDYRHEARHRTMTLRADEFIRRFLLHASTSSVIDYSRQPSMTACSSLSVGLPGARSLPGTLPSNGPF